MKIRDYSYSENRITAKRVDGYYLWIAYLGSSGTCTLKKVDVNNPTLVYFDLTMNVSEITWMKIYGDYLYCSVDSSSYIGIKIDKDNPLGTGNIDYISKPVTTTEKSVDLAIDATYLYLLVSGEVSGECAKIFKYNKTSLVLSDTFNLEGTPSGDTRIYLRTMVIRSGYLWVFSYEKSTKWVKVDVSDGSYTFGEIA